MLKDPFPDTRLGPAAEPPMHILPVAEALRQIAPGNAGPVAVEHGFDEPAVVRRGHSDRALPPRQQVLDPVPLVVAKPVAAHRSAPQS